MILKLTNKQPKVPNCKVTYSLNMKKTKSMATFSLVNHAIQIRFICNYWYVKIFLNILKAVNFKKLKKGKKSKWLKMLISV